MSAITTHVLDIARGLPAEGVPVVLKFRDGASWRELGRGRTDADGRLRTLLPEGETPVAGAYQISFDTGGYFAAQGTKTFYPEVVVLFTLAEGGGHCHVPLLLSPFGYSTYRGT